MKPSTETKEGDWIAWRSVKSNGTASKWSNNHYTLDYKSTLCGIVIPGHGQIFDREVNSSNSYRDCEKCTKKLSKGPAPDAG